jgi:hypothetical protein
MCHLKNVILTLLGSIFGRIYMISMVYCWCCSVSSNPAEGEQNKLSAQKSYSTLQHQQYTIDIIYIRTKIEPNSVRITLLRWHIFVLPPQDLNRSTNIPSKSYPSKYLTPIYYYLVFFSRSVERNKMDDLYLESWEDLMAVDSFQPQPKRKLLANLFYRFVI